MPGFIKGMQTKHVSLLYRARNESLEKPLTNEQLMSVLEEVRREIAITEAEFKKLPEREKDAKAEDYLLKVRDLANAEREISARIGYNLPAMGARRSLREATEAKKEPSTNAEIIAAMKEVHREMAELEARISEVKKLMADIEGKLEHSKEYAKYLEELWRLNEAWDKKQKKTMSLVEALERAGGKKTSK